MLTLIANVFYVLIAISMVVLILMQRGAGADAGSGFGGGASATVFGARGSANFLSRSTAVLAALFFLLSLGMGIFHSRGGPTNPSDDLGVMAGAVAPAAKPAAAAGDTSQPGNPKATTEIPAPANTATPAPGTPPSADVPAANAPAAATPATAPASATAAKPVVAPHSSEGKPAENKQADKPKSGKN